MNIVIIGGGTVGAAICAELSAEKHNITIVDGNAAAVEEIASTCDVFGVVGNGADVSVLRKAGTEKADRVIAVTSGDELNILCCAAAKKPGGAEHRCQSAQPGVFRADVLDEIRNESFPHHQPRAGGGQGDLPLPALPCGGQGGHLLPRPCGNGGVCGGREFPSLRGDHSYHCLERLVPALPR